MGALPPGALGTSCHGLCGLGSQACMVLILRIIGLEVGAHAASGSLSANTLPLPDLRGFEVTVKAGGYRAMLRGLPSAVAH